LHGGPTTYGFLLGAFGLGGIAGAWTHGRLRDRLASERVVQFGCLATLTGAAVAGVSSFVPLTLAGMLFSGAGWVLTLSTFNVTVQVSSPRWIISRAISLYHMFSFGGMALGSWIFGMVADKWNVSAALLGAAGLQALGIATGFLIPVVEDAQARLDVAEKAICGPLRQRLESTVGRVVINNDYSIRADDRDSFLRLMDQRQRHCRRNGANRWTLVNHANNPDLWTERFELPSGVEYLRYLQRQTPDQLHLDRRLNCLAVLIENTHSIP
jgi:MFS family permease